MRHHEFDPPGFPSCTSQDLGARLRLIRSEVFGEDGVGDLVRALGLPARTWLNYEGGVVIPGHILLAFLEIAGAESRWLLTGTGPRYRAGRPGPDVTPDRRKEPGPR